MPPTKAKSDPVVDSAGITDGEFVSESDPVVDSAGITDGEFVSEPDPVDDSAGITDGEFVSEPKVKARYVGIEPVMAHFDGAAVLVEPGDPIMVSAEQLAQNPVFESWED